MDFTPRDITDAMEKINIKLASPEQIDQEEIDAIQRAANMLIGFTYNLCKKAGGISFLEFYQNPEFERFMHLYGEFCFHTVKRELDSVEIDAALKRFGL